MSGRDEAFSIKLILLDTYRDFRSLFWPVLYWSKLVLAFIVVSLFVALYDSVVFRAMSETIGGVTDDVASGTSGTPSFLPFLSALITAFLTVFPPMVFVFQRLLASEAARYGYLQCLASASLWKVFSYWLLTKIVHFIGYLLLATLVTGVSHSAGMPLIGSAYQREILLLASAVVGIWVWIKFVCVIPLVVLGEQRPLGLSWRMARGCAVKMAFCYCLAGLIIWAIVAGVAMGLLFILQMAAPLLASSLVLYSAVLGTSFYLGILFLITSSAIFDANVYRVLVKLRSDQNA